MRKRNQRIRAEVEALRGDGIELMVAISIIAKRNDLSWRTVRDILYDSRRK